MKRGRTSRVSGPSFLDLPKDLLQNILFRLPIKSILLCKSVCKTSYDLISDPEFSKLYFDETRYRFYPLIHANKFYLLKPDKDDFEPNNVDFVFDTKFDLSSFIQDSLIELSKCSRESRRRHVRRCGVRPLVLTVSYSINIANSCNGLLCCFFQGPKSHATICNPITGEFVEIPECTNPDDFCEGFVIYGFGFSHVDNKYKVVRIVDYSGTTRVHAVGTESWRDISTKPDYPISNCQPTFFKGFLYWTTSQESLSLMFFDIGNECFGLDSGPVDEPYAYMLVNVGILRGELCISSVPKSKTIHIWTRKDSGVEITQWSKVYSIDLSGMPIEGSLEPIEFLSDGSLLMFYYRVNAFIHVDPEKRRFRFFKIEGKKMRVQRIFPHVPSLVSLKHSSLLEHNVKLLNVHHQRCEVLK